MRTSQNSRESWARHGTCHRRRSSLSGLHLEGQVALGDNRVYATLQALGEIQWHL